MLLAVIVMGAVEDEGTFWIQLLMLVILAAGTGAYILARSRLKRAERHMHDEKIETIIVPPKPLVITHASSESPVAGGKPRQKNLSGGMELLTGNFLVSVVERTDSPDRRDVEMRRLCFTELARRGELHTLADAALKVYTLDADGFYGKIIRREAMAELASRPPNAAEAAPPSSENREQAESTAHHVG